MPIPLSPDAGGRSIDVDALQVADIIVSTTSSFVSGAIRIGTSSEVSHTALYIGGSQVVEALSEGVLLQDLETSLADNKLAVVYRVPKLTDSQRLKVRDYVGRNIGLPYSHIGAVGAGLAYRDRKGATALSGAYACAKAGICMQPEATKQYKADLVDSFICSQLVFSAFQDAGIPLTVGNAREIVPGDYPDMWVKHILLYVGHLKSN